MRIHSIACAAIYLIGSGCSGELTQRAPANDPGSVAAAEAPYHAPPAYQPDPLLSPLPPKSPEAPPTGHEQMHSPTATPPGNPPMREEPGGKVPGPPHGHDSMPGMHHDTEHPAASVYTCPMHPDVRRNEPGKCPKCSMTLVPATPKSGGR